jgi:hypothetical protein
LIRKFLNIITNNATGEKIAKRELYCFKLVKCLRTQGGAYAKNECALSGMGAEVSLYVQLPETHLTKGG